MTESLSLFEDIVVDAPRTEGIKYAGSKLKLLPYILQLAKRVGARTVLDGFSGTTRVSQALAQRGYTVLSNDIAVWSEVFGTCYLLSKRRRTDYQPLIDHCSAPLFLDTKKGGCYQHPCGKAGILYHIINLLSSAKSTFFQLSGSGACRLCHWLSNSTGV